MEKFINPLIQNQKHEDTLHTFCEHIAFQIGKHLENETAIFTGGGGGAQDGAVEGPNGR